MSREIDLALDCWEENLIHNRKSGHTAAECEEPRSAEGVECKKCNESMLSNCTPAASR